MKKKALSILLIAMLLFSVFPAGAFAEDSVDADKFVIELSSVEDVKPEDGTVDILVSIKNNPGVWAFNFVVTAETEDGKQLEVEKYTKTDNETGYTVTTSGAVLVEGTEIENNYYVGEIATATFKVDKAEAGAVYSVKVAYEEGSVFGLDSNLDFVDVDADFVAGKIAMAKPVEYAVTVNGGTATPDKAIAGAEVTVTADSKDGYNFVKWTADAEDVEFANATAPTTTFKMPAKDVTVTAEFAEIVPDKYVVAVAGGSGSGNYEADATVNIKANAAAEGKVFDKWVVEEGNVTFDVTKAEVTFTMPAEAVKVTATYKDVVYEVVVTGGTATPAKAVKGTEVTLKANAAEEGKVFDKWVVKEGNVTFDVTKAEVTFTMPAKNVVVDATYKAESSQPGSGSTGGGSSSGGSSGGGGAIIMPSTSINKDTAKQNVIILTIGEKIAKVNGKDVVCDVAPLIVDGRTYTPARFVAEQLGAKVAWDEAKQLVTVTEGDTVIELTIGSNIAKVNGKAVEMDAAAFIKDGRTYTPARFVAEQLGAKVVWDDVTRQVTITETIEVK